ncbi:MAG: DUF4931 domain-containing protein [Candidatus Micrarchaeia archaeon]
MILEFREDPTKKTVVVFASKRAARPKLFGKKVSCPFCKGAEHSTPPTTFASPSEKNWKVRSFRNLFAAFSPQKPFKKKTSGFWKSFAFGDHEIIVESEDHRALFQDLNEDNLQLVFKAYANRVRGLSKRKGIKYVFLFKNHGRVAGASVDHEHAQIVALPFVPELIQREVDSEKKNNGCLYCRIMKLEKSNTLFENESFVAITPSFARFPSEIWVLPKEHKRFFSDFSNNEGLNLLKIIARSVEAVYHTSKDYNVVFHISPKEEDLHFHVEIYPRPNVWAGLELGAGLIINTKTEKDAFKALKGF